MDHFCFLSSLYFLSPMGTTLLLIKAWSPQSFKNKVFIYWCKLPSLGIMVHTRIVNQIKFWKCRFLCKGEFLPLRTLVLPGLQSFLRDCILRVEKLSTKPLDTVSVNLMYAEYLIMKDIFGIVKSFCMTKIWIITDWGLRWITEVHRCAFRESRKIPPKYSSGP